jgi:hypothetical protein
MVPLGAEQKHLQLHQTATKTTSQIRSAQKIELKDLPWPSPEKKLFQALCASSDFTLNHMPYPVVSIVKDYARAEVPLLRFHPVDKDVKAQWYCEESNVWLDIEPQNLACEGYTAEKMVSYGRNRCLDVIDIISGSGQKVVVNTRFESKNITEARHRAVAVGKYTPSLYLLSTLDDNASTSHSSTPDGDDDRDRALIFSRLDLNTCVWHDLEPPPPATVAGRTSFALVCDEEWVVLVGGIPDHGEFCHRYHIPTQSWFPAVRTKPARVGPILSSRHSVTVYRSTLLLLDPRGVLCAYDLTLAVAEAWCELWLQASCEGERNYTSISVLPSTNNLLLSWQSRGGRPSHDDHATMSFDYVLACKQQQQHGPKSKSHTFVEHFSESKAKARFIPAEMYPLDPE